MKREVLIEVNEIIKELLFLVQNELRSSGVTILADALPRIQANRTQLQQVLMNLIRNAIETMRHVSIGERNLTVRTAIGKDDNLLITVVDAGPGIPPEDVRARFDRIEPRSIGHPRA